MNPTIGRIVLFTNDELLVCPAIVTAVNADDTLGLTVFEVHHHDAKVCPAKATFHKSVAETKEEAGTEAAKGLWRWPPQV